MGIQKMIPPPPPEEFKKRTLNSNGDVQKWFIFWFSFYLFLQLRNQAFFLSQLKKKITSRSMHALLFLLHIYNNI